MIIDILDEKDEGEQFEFRVEVSVKNTPFRYHVTLKKMYWRHLTGGKSTPREFIVECFRFLLEREPASSILKRFDVEIIKTYFPEFESEIAKI